jgi:hypothetical protein
MQCNKIYIKLIRYRFYGVPSKQTNANGTLCSTSRLLATRSDLGFCFNLWMIEEDRYKLLSPIFSLWNFCFVSLSADDHTTKILQIQILHMMSALFSSSLSGCHSSRHGWYSCCLYYYFKWGYLRYCSDLRSTYGRRLDDIWWLIEQVKVG